MWDREIKELERRRNIARQMGGEKNIAKQHGIGRMTVRERIDALVDKGSFLERGILAGVPTYDKDEKDKLIDLIPCPFVMGIARINGRRVALHGDDFTIKGASVGRMYKAKGAYFLKMARTLQLPIIRLLEGAGGSIKEILEIGYTELPSSGDECTQNRVEVMSEVPVVSAGFGSVAGLGAMYMVQSHFSVMVKEQAHVFVGGPPRHHGDSDDPKRREEELLSIIPRDVKKPYDIRKILSLVLDRDSIFELGKYQGKSQVTALACLDGYPVGILANDPRFMAGSFNYDVAEKFTRFIDMCDTFHLPIVNLSDQPGFTIGKKAEEYGTIRKGVRASFAIVQATIPIAVVYLRKCFGVAGGAQKSGIRLSWRYAWPSAVWGNIPVEGGVYAAHRAGIEAADDPEAYLRDLQNTYRAIQSPFRTAEAFGIEDIIDPRDTRPLLCDWVEMAYEIEKNNLGVKKRGMRC